MNCTIPKLTEFDKQSLHRYATTIYHFLYNYDNTRIAFTDNDVKYFKDSNADTFCDWRNTGCWKYDFDEGAHRLANDNTVKHIGNVVYIMRKLVYAHLYNDALIFAKQLKEYEA